MEKQKIAKLVSYALGMHVWFPVLLVVSMFKTGLSPRQIQILFPSLFFLDVVIPIAYIGIALKLGKISEWDVPKREERHGFMILVFFLGLISMAFIFFFGNKLLFNLNIILLALLFMMLLITRFWKISLHASLSTAGSIVVNFLFGWQLPILYLSIPLVLWARFVLGRHDVKQLVAGVFLTAIFIIGAFRYFGYI